MVDYSKSKFANEIAEKYYEMSLDGSHDEEIGSVDELGWYAIFRAIDSTGKTVIVHEDSQGFVDAEEYTTEQGETAWYDIEREYETFGNE